MAPLVKTPATNSNDPNSTPGTHRVNGENHSSKLSSDFHTRVMVCHDPHIQVCAQAHEMSYVQTYMEREQEKRIVTEEDTPCQPLLPQVHEHLCIHVHIHKEVNKIIFKKFKLHFLCMKTT